MEVVIDEIGLSDSTDPRAREPIIERLDAGLSCRAELSRPVLESPSDILAQRAALHSSALNTGRLGVQQR
jgi:hypothetical protein